MSKYQIVTRREIPGGTIPRVVPRGYVLMHNHIWHTARTRQSTRGFRGWFDVKPPAGFVPCDCGWSGLPHYARKQT